MGWLSRSRRATRKQRKVVVPITPPPENPASYQLALRAFRHVPPPRRAPGQPRTTTHPGALTAHTPHPHPAPQMGAKP